MVPLPSKILFVSREFHLNENVKVLQPPNSLQTASLVDESIHSSVSFKEKKSAK